MDEGTQYNYFTKELDHHTRDVLKNDSSSRGKRDRSQREGFISPDPYITRLNKSYYTFIIARNVRSLSNVGTR